MRSDDRLQRTRLDPSLWSRTPWWERFPVVGWIAGSCRRRWITLSIAREIDAALLSRDPVPIAAWGDDPEVRRCADVTLRAIREEMSWTDARFRPDDDAAVALWDWKDALDASCTILRIEERLGLSISDEEIVEMTRGTLGELVAALARRVGSSPP